MSLANIVNKVGVGYQLRVPVYFYTDIVGYEIHTAHIDICHDGLVFLREAFTWDGATCAPDIEAVILPSALHDAFYRCIRLGLLPRKVKALADKSFYKEIRLRRYRRKLSNTQDIINFFVADIYYTGVRWFGFIGLLNNIG